MTTSCIVVKLYLHKQLPRVPDTSMLYKSRCSVSLGSVLNKSASKFQQLLEATILGTTLVMISYVSITLVTFLKYRICREASLFYLCPQGLFREPS